jgi:DNA polymerase
MPDTLLFLDFETYYDPQYSLRKMTVPEYVLDRRFQTIMVACAKDEGPTDIIDGPDFPQYLYQFDPTKTHTIAFNALFDNAILAWQYGFVPKRMTCTMALTRALRGHLLKNGASLAAVSQLLGLDVKGTYITQMAGRHREDVRHTPDWKPFCDYATIDNNNNRHIFYSLIQELPHSERRIMDRVLRCAIEPKFWIDTDMLKAHMQDCANERRDLLLEAAGVPNGDPGMLGPVTEEELSRFATTMRSTAKFQKLLESRGINIEYKTSPTGKTVPAFAKTDGFMAELMEHEDPQVQAMAAARLGVRSTIEQTRGKRILDIAALPWQKLPDGNPRLYSGGTMPIPLGYGKTHTHRLAGEWGINMQNLPSSRTKGSKLRKSLIAPPGHKVCVADLEQIEARICAWICGQASLVSQFRNKKDPYSILGAAIFGTPLPESGKFPSDSMERFIGKGGILGLGFGCGAEKFYNMVIRTARVMGMDINKLLLTWTPELAQKSVDTYRRQNNFINAAWSRLNVILETSWIGVSGPTNFGPVEIGPGYVKLPNDLMLRYKVVHPVERGNLLYTYGKKTHRMYGPKMLENIVQALARNVVMHAALRIGDRGFPFRLQAHDELAFIVPDEQIAEAQAIITEEMRRPPSWAPNLPLGSSWGVGQSYGEAK